MGGGVHKSLIPWRIQVAPGICGPVFGPFCVTPRFVSYSVDKLFPNFFGFDFAASFAFVTGYRQFPMHI